jgi:hypothetical protein
LRQCKNMKSSNSVSTFHTSGQLVVSPVRRRNTSLIRLRRYVPRPEDSQQVRDCLFGTGREKYCPDFRFKLPNPKFIKNKNWITHSKYMSKEDALKSNDGTAMVIPRYAPNPHDSTQVNNLIKNVSHPSTPNFEYNRNNNNNDNNFRTRATINNNPLYISPNSSSDNSDILSKHVVKYDNNAEDETFNEKPLVETMLTFRKKRRRNSTHNFSVFSDPSNQYTRTYRVGEHSGVMNNARPDLALRGVLKSNLPTMEGVLGLGDLNRTTWRALGGVPHERHKLHASAKLHPTYRTIQVEKMLGQEHSDEILDSLRKRGNTHSPIRQFVQHGQGTAREINWVQQTRNSRLKMEDREKYLNTKIFVANRIHPGKKEVKNLDISGLYNNSKFV